MSNDTLRSVTLERTSTGQYIATNASGSKLAFGHGDDQFSPVELLLAAIAGCTAIDVDFITSRRAEPTSFEVEASGDKVSTEDGNRMENLEVVFRVAFPEGADGDKARDVLPQAITRSHDRLCTVSRTVELGTPVTTRAE
jgi:putative redox protein